METSTLILSIASIVVALAAAWSVSASKRAINRQRPQDNKAVSSGRKKHKDTARAITDGKLHPLTAYRWAKGLSIEELAQAAGVSTSVVRSIERRQSPPVDIPSSIVVFVAGTISGTSDVASSSGTIPGDGGGSLGGSSHGV